jgi:hypothetical protein
MPLIFIFEWQICIALEYLTAIYTEIKPRDLGFWLCKKTQQKPCIWVSPNLRLEALNPLPKMMHKSLYLLLEIMFLQT